MAEAVSPTNISAVNLSEKATKYKEIGNHLFREKQYGHAVTSYTKAIKLDVEDARLVTSLHTNRAASYFNLGQYQASLDDCQKALHHTPNHLKAIIRGIECLTVTGHYGHAGEWCDGGLSCFPTDKKLLSFKDQLLHLQDAYQNPFDLPTDVEVIVQKIRKTLEKYKISNACGMANYILADKLRRGGYHVELVLGIYQTDIVGDVTYNHPHVFVVYNNMWLDATHSAISNADKQTMQFIKVRYLKWSEKIPMFLGDEDSKTKGYAECAIKELRAWTEDPNMDEMIKDAPFYVLPFLEACKGI